MAGRRRQIWAVLIGAMVIAVAIVLALQMAPQAPQRAPSSMRIARIHTPHSGLLHIAEAKGYFAEEGLAATMQTTPTGYDALQAVVNGAADVGAAAETPIARALDEGKQLKIIATIFTSTSNAGIVARKDRGISKPDDLRGKTIGFVFGTATHYMLETFLAYNGIPLDAVTLAPIKADQVVGAITSDDVDAVACWDPSFARVQRELGDNGTTFSSGEFYAETYNLTVNPVYAAERREEIERLLRALLRAEEFARAYPDEAMKIIATVSGTDIDLFHDHWNPRIYELTLSQSMLLATENEADWYIRRGMVPGGQRPDILSVFEIEPLRAIKPSGVSIVK